MRIEIKRCVLLFGTQFTTRAEKTKDIQVEEMITGCGQTGTNLVAIQVASEKPQDDS